MSKHTPGPWVALYQPGRDAEIATVSWVGEWCVGVNTPGFPGCNYRDTKWGDTEADARLIAAAPDLLEAIKGLLEVHGVRQDSADIGLVNQSWVDISDLARAAVAKATGAQA